MARFARLVVPNHPHHITSPNVVSVLWTSLLMIKIGSPIYSSWLKKQNAQVLDSCPGA